MELQNDDLIFRFILIAVNLHNSHDFAQQKPTQFLPPQHQKHPTTHLSNPQSHILLQQHTKSVLVYHHPKFEMCPLGGN